MNIHSIFGQCFVGLLRFNHNGRKSFHYSGVCSNRIDAVNRLLELAKERIESEKFPSPIRFYDLFNQAS